VNGKKLEYGKTAHVRVRRRRASFNNFWLLCLKKACKQERGRERRFGSCRLVMSVGARQERGRRAKQYAIHSTFFCCRRLCLGFASAAADAGGAEPSLALAFCSSSSFALCSSCAFEITYSALTGAMHFAIFSCGCVEGQCTGAVF
jgi:hypothetical protein